MKKNTIIKRKTIQPWYMFSCAINEASIGNLIIEILKSYQFDQTAEFTLYISSTGGDLDSAIRFYDFVKALKPIIRTVGFGQIDSAATIMLISSKERILIDKSRLRLHAPTYNSCQPNSPLRDHIEGFSLIKQINDRYFEILKENLPKVDDIVNLYEQGSIIDTKKALELGFCTKIENNMPVYQFVRESTSCPLPNQT